MARLKYTATACWIGLLAGALALGIAHIAQAHGLVPCALCYLERWPYRVAIALGLLGLIWPAARRAIASLLILTFLAALALACVHIGVELHWWKSPLPECAAPVLATGSISAMLASMPTHVSKPCDDPTYLIPGVKISMAQLNALFALASTILIAANMPRRRA